MLNMKKALFIIGAILLCLVISIVIVGYNLIMTQIDVIWSEKLSEVMSSNDISKIDEYFTDDAVIVCNDKKGDYSSLRNNVVRACEEKRYNISSSYGNGNNLFIFGVQKIGIYVYGEFHGDGESEYANYCWVDIKLKRTGLFTFAVSYLESNTVAFEHIFFG
jgi:hypothetical protein